MQRDHGTKVVHCFGQIFGGIRQTRKNAVFKLDSSNRLFLIYEREKAIVLEADGRPGGSTSGTSLSTLLISISTATDLCRISTERTRRHWFLCRTRIPSTPARAPCFTLTRSPLCRKGYGSTATEAPIVRCKAAISSTGIADGAPPNPTN